MVRPAAGDLQGDAGSGVVRSAVDDAALGIERHPARLADGAQPAFSRTNSSRENEPIT